MIGRSAPPQRLIALDVFRGLTIALMILVNNPGSWAHIHPPLRHARWHGWTPTDLVFPFFLFIVGVAMALSFARRQEQGAARGDLVRKILIRAALIFACGLLLNAYPFGLPLSAEAAANFSMESVAEHFENLRVMGVLQRIALCYLAVGMLVTLLSGFRSRLAIGIFCIILYEVLMRVPLVSGWGASSFALEDNLVRWLDLRLLGEDRLWQGAGLPFDPEGLLSTLPAIATTLLGFFTGEFLRRGSNSATHRIRPLFLCGAGVAALGLALGLLEPINKQLWSSSYMFLTGGLAMACLSIAIWAIDVRGWRAWSRPAVVFGSNPLVVFVGSGLLARTLGQMHTGEGISVQRWLYTRIFQPLAGDVNGSLLHAIVHILFWLGVLWILYRRKIFVKL
jgi:predicted acyltransferase